MLFGSVAFFDMVQGLYKFIFVNIRLLFRVYVHYSLVFCFTAVSFAALINISSLLLIYLSHLQQPNLDSSNPIFFELLLKIYLHTPRVFRFLFPNFLCYVFTLTYFHV